MSQAFRTDSRAVFGYSGPSKSHSHQPRKTRAFSMSTTEEGTRHPCRYCWGKGVLTGCQACGGMGRFPCSSCGGTGKKMNAAGFDEPCTSCYSMSRTCDTCKGSGKGEERQCGGCNGLGYRILVGKPRPSGFGCIGDAIVLVLFIIGILFLGALVLGRIGK
jgi:hypothetical protein